MKKTLRLKKQNKKKKKSQLIINMMKIYKKQFKK